MINTRDNLDEARRCQSLPDHPGRQQCLCRDDRVFDGCSTELA